MSSPGKNIIDINVVPKENSKGVGFFKNFFVFILLIGVIVSSFWVSYLLGKRILVPVRNLPEPKIEVVIPETVHSVAALEEFEEEVVKEPAEVKSPPKVKFASVRQYYKVQSGLYANRARALGLEKKLKSSGFQTYLRKINTGWRVQVGAFTKKVEALGLQRLLSTKGFTSTLVYE